MDEPLARIRITGATRSMVLAYAADVLGRSVPAKATRVGDDEWEVQVRVRTVLAMLAADVDVSSPAAIEAAVRERIEREQS